MDVIERIEKREVFFKITREKTPCLHNRELGKLNDRDRNELLRLAKLGLEAEKRIKQLLESKYYQKDVPEPLQYLFCYYEFLKIQGEPLPELLKGEE